MSDCLGSENFAPSGSLAAETPLWTENECKSSNPGKQLKAYGILHSLIATSHNTQQPWMMGGVVPTHAEKKTAPWLRTLEMLLHTRMHTHPPSAKADDQPRSKTHNRL